jgi:hypothetical protein
MLPGDESDPAGDALDDVLEFALAIVPDPVVEPEPEPTLFVVFAVAGTEWV